MIDTFVYGESDRDRSQAWVAFATQVKEPVVLYLAAGRLPLCRQEKLNVQMYRSIKDMLYYAGYRLESQKHNRRVRRFCFINRNRLGGVPHVITIELLQKNVWGTFEETLTVIRMLRRKNTQKKLRRVVNTITVFSSQSHLPRIASIWQYIGKEFAVTYSASAVDMDNTLQNMESSKDRMNQAFFKVYDWFGVLGVDVVSFWKNLILNRILQVQTRKT